MPLKTDRVTENRLDFSRFMVHLTRDDRFEWPDENDQGMTARENFDNILLRQEIMALKLHCLHRKEIPKQYLDKLNVCCFTETPLDQIEHLIDIPGRQVNLEAYGFAFSREFMLWNGAQQVMHVNGYAGAGLKASFDPFLAKAISAKFKNVSWKVLAFISAQHEGYDFSWEREYRILGNLKFDLTDLEFVVLPDGDDDELVESLARRGISYICPGWTYERIAQEVGKQQKMTRRLLTPKRVVKLQPRKCIRIKPVIRRQG